MAAVRPHLAITAEDLTTLPYPLMASRKKDGFRGLITEDGAQTRSGETFPNPHVQALLSALPVGLDGEVLPLVDGKANFRVGGGNLRRSTGEPAFEFWIIDDFLASGTRHERHQRLCERKDLGEFPPWVKILTQHWVTDADQVRRFFAMWLLDGDEGVVLCKPDAAYKGGKASGKNATWWKVKPYEDAEAVIIGAFQRMKNTNEATKDKLGHTKRRNTKDAKEATGLLGGFVCVPLPWWEDRPPSEARRILENPKLAEAVSFEVSAGKTDKKEKEALWKQWVFGTSLKARVIRYQHVTVGDYDKPRHGTFQGFRDKWDLDPTK